MTIATETSLPSINIPRKIKHNFWISLPILIMTGIDGYVGHKLRLVLFVKDGELGRLIQIVGDRRVRPPKTHIHSIRMDKIPTTAEWSDICAKVRIRFEELRK